MLSPIDEWNINRGLDSGKKSICYKKLENGYVVILMAEGAYTIECTSEENAQKLVEKIKVSNSINSVQLVSNVIAISQKTTDWTSIMCDENEDLAINLVKRLRTQEILNLKAKQKYEKARQAERDKADTNEVEYSR